jgi:hypothetical protein
LQVNDILAGTQADVSATLSKLSDALPSVSSGTAVADMTDAARQQYNAAMHAAGSALDSYWSKQDKALKSLGIRDQTVLEKLQSGIEDAWNSFASALGVHEQTVWERLEDLVPSQGAFKRALKSVGIIPRTPVEEAMEQYTQALNSVHHFFSKEDVPVSEKLMQTVQDGLDSVRQAGRYVGLVPQSATLPQRVQQQLGHLNERAARALIQIERESQRLLRSGRLQGKAAAQEASESLESARRALWTALGYKDPSFLQKMSWYLDESLHTIKSTLGMEEPTIGETIIDAATGKPASFFGGAPGGVLGRLKAAVVGA